MQKKGPVRKKRRRVRRQLRHTYDEERVGTTPQDAIAIAEQEREAPEPKDGELFTGPLSYVLQDLKRVQGLKDQGQFTDREWYLMTRKIASVIKGGGYTAISAYRVLQNVRQKDQAAALKMLELKLRAFELEQKHGKSDEGDGDVHNHLHIHGAQVDPGSPVQTFLKQMQAAQGAGEGFEDLDNDDDVITVIPEEKKAPKKKQPAKKKARKRKAIA